VAVLDRLRATGMTTVVGSPDSTELGFLDRWPADFRLPPPGSGELHTNMSKLRSRAPQEGEAPCPSSPCPVAV
jgi:hypothetical protein